MMAMAPSLVTLQAVPKLSMAMYRAMISACASVSNPKMDAKGARAAMMAPPGTPGAATMMMASKRMKWRNNGKSCGSPSSMQMVRAQAVTFIEEPGMWMVAQSGTVKPATPLSTPFFSLCLKVTGMVAADDAVPNAVR